MAVPYQIVVKNGARYHFYPKGRSGAGRPEYIPVTTAKMTQGKGSAAGSAPAPSAQPGAAPAAPSPSAAVIDPFLRPEDLQALADFSFGQANSLADIDKGLADLATQTSYDRVQTDKGAQQATDGAQENAIARGLFHSSIKDATLYDIEGQRVRSQQLFTDRQNNATLDADRRKGILQHAQEQLAERMRQQAVENARAVSAAQAVAVPTAAPGVATAPKPPAAPKPKVAAKPKSQWQQGAGYARV